MVRKVLLAATMACVAAQGSAVLAQDHHDDHNDDHHGGYVRHDDWRKGGHIAPGDWNRGQHIDYRRYHLSAPPHGYEWRQVDGNYVLAAAATGLIASTIIASTVH